MAHCLRRPALAAARFHVSQLGHDRPFSVLSALQGALKAPQPQMPKQQAARSLRIAGKEHSQTQMPSDLGLLPATFVAPSLSSPLRPSVFTSPARALSLQWTRLKVKSRDFLTLLVYKFQSKPRITLRFRASAPAAVGLHRQVYTAFAEGDAETLSKLCSEGLLANFRARILARPRGERWEWAIVKYNKRARVMSHRGASLGVEGMGIRQVVVRISSRQKLTRYKADGSIVPNTGKEKDVTEYFVIQKNMRGGKEGEWTVWGTTEETDLDKFQAEQLAVSLGQ